MKTSSIHINVANIEKHFFLGRPPRDPSSANRTKTVRHSLIAINEANICQKLRKIPYYASFFSLVDKHQSLQIAEITGETYSTLDENKYYLFTYSDAECVDFGAFLYNMTSIREMMFRGIHTFQHLLQGLSLFERHQMIFFQFSPNRIVFLAKDRENPVLRDFRTSLQRPKLSIDYLKEILDDLGDMEYFTYFPLEIHVFYAVTKRNLSTISYAFVEEYSEQFVKNLSFLRMFSEKYTDIYQQECVETLRKYINLPQKQILNDILERSSQWDIYGLSILYLHIFGSMNRVFSLKGTFFSKITMELVKNLHPDSTKRGSIEGMRAICAQLLEEQEDWSFVQNLDNNKLSTLFEELGT